MTVRIVPMMLANGFLDDSGSLATTVVVVIVEVVGACCSCSAKDPSRHRFTCASGV